MPDTAPFQEAIDAFRDKLSIPSNRWDDIFADMNAKAFTVAGATTAEIVGDFRVAVDEAISQGLSIGEFRQQFDSIVERHGWSYKGSRGWRSRVIYDTNLRTAHMAGRWAQIQRVKSRRPFLQYLTAGDARVRPEHAQWDEKVLPVDDEWWQSHYPPNGWGCRCTVRSLSQRDVDRLGLTVEAAPDVVNQARVLDSGEVVEVPDGIDTGWDYNVGAAWLGPDAAFGRQVMILPDDLRRAALDQAPDMMPVLNKSFRRWGARVLATGQATGAARSVGFLSNDLVDALAARSVSVRSTVITADDKTLLDIETNRQSLGGDGPAVSAVTNLPRSFDRAAAVAFDSSNNRLLYVLARSDDGTPQLTVGVDLDVEDAVNRQPGSLRTNTVRAIAVDGLDSNDLEVVLGDV